MADNLSTILEANVQARPLPQPPRPIEFGGADDAPEAELELIGFAEGQSFMIEYVDSGGRMSRRRITVFGIVLGRGGIPLLSARCHEKKAMRQFRVDRIRCCIDFDGEIHEDVTDFLEQNFGMGAEYASKRPDDQMTKWRDLVDVVRDDAVILAAMSQADGYVIGVEIETAVDHLAKVAEATGQMLSDAEIAELGRHFRRLRPTGDAIRRALDNLGRHEAGRVHKLLMAAVAVLDADGRRHPAELELLNAMCLDLTGSGLVGRA